MLSTIVLALCSFVLSLVLTPLIRDCAVRFGWLDKPDFHRKLHLAPVPRIGGIPIVLAYAGAFGILLLIGLRGTLSVQLPLPLISKLLPAALLVFLTGLLDDLVGLKPWQKLLGVTVAAVLACTVGLRIEGVAYHDMNAVFGVPLTIVWLVGCANAFNLIDGIDGLASGVGLLATLTTLAAGLLHGDVGLVMVTAPLAGALFGFLRYNVNPASIFLGDCGSLSVGFMLGCYGVIWSQKSATVLGITAPMMALSVPLLDTALSIARRYLRRQPIFGADHGHIHHRLLERGLTPRRVVFLLYAATAVAACLSLLQSVAWNGAGGLIVALFGAAVWIGIQYLGYKEFGIAARLLRQNSFRATIQSNLSLHGYEESLRSAASAEECWRAVRTGCGEFGFSHVALRLAGRSFHEQLDNTSGPHCTLHIPFSQLDYIQLKRRFDVSTAPATITPWVDLLYRALSAKAAEFSPPDEETRQPPPKVMTAGYGSYQNLESIAGSPPIRNLG